MARKRLIIKMGMGVDQHGQEPMAAAARAVRAQQGGIIVQGRAIASLNDRNDEMLIAVAAVTVLVETD